MSFSFTGLAYLLGFLGLGLLTRRLYQYWLREKTTVSKLFLCLSAALALFMLITAIAGLFFAKNPQVLRGTVISSTFIQSFAFAVIGYLLIYLKFPQISPWLGFTPLLIFGLIVTVLTIVIPFNPYLEPNGSINWNTQPVVDTFRFVLVLITFLPLVIVLIQEIRTSSEGSIIKAKALGISVLLIFGILIGLFDFLLEKIFKLGTISSDIATGILGIAAFLIILYARGPSSLKANKPLRHSSKTS